MNSQFKYCYNAGDVEANTYGRVGGICGASVGIQIYASYNIGNIKGQKGTAIFSASIIDGFELEGIKSGVGGLVGVAFCNDFRYDGQWRTLFKLPLTGIEIKFPYIAHVPNQVKICKSYSSGNISRRCR